MPRASLVQLGAWGHWEPSALRALLDQQATLVQWVTQDHPVIRASWEILGYLAQLASPGCLEMTELPVRLDHPVLWESPDPPDPLDPRVLLVWTDSLEVRASMEQREMMASLAGRARWVSRVIWANPGVRDPSDRKVLQELLARTGWLELQALPEYKASLD